MNPQAPIVNADGDLACPACGSTTFARFATESVVDKVWGRPGGWIDSKNVDATASETRWECWNCEIALSSPYDVE